MIAGSKKHRMTLAAWGLLATILFGGCTDMPVITKDSNPVKPRILMGPYLTADHDGQLIMRFMTNITCVAGLSYKGNLKGRTDRFSSYNTFHSLEIDPAEGSGSRHGRVMLGSVDAGSFYIPGVPVEGGPATIAFTGGNTDPETATKADRLLQGLNLDALFICESPLKEETAKIEKWKENFFLPLKSTVEHAPVYFIPGVAQEVPKKLYPDRRASVWSQDFGCIHVISLDATLLINPSSRNQVIKWLKNDVNNRRGTVIWTVLVLNRPVFGSRYVNARALNALGNTIETANINLIISGGTPYYHRTLPMDKKSPVESRYISIGGLCPLERQGTGREYSAILSERPHISVLSGDQGELEWRVVAVDKGDVIDRVVIKKGGGDEAGEPRISRSEILNEALAVLALRHEVVAMARQVCQAVDNPETSQKITITMGNPTGLEFKGNIIWEVPADSPWKVKPEQTPFDLKPGVASQVTFTFNPTGNNGKPPVIRVDAGKVGFVRHPLVITQKRKGDAALLAGQVRVDGYPNERFWRKAVELKGFTLLGGKKKSKRIIRAWLAAMPEGLSVVMRCEAKRPSRIKTTVKQHDGMIHHDESVELFIDPSDSGRGYYQFAVNVKNRALDRSSRHGLSYNPKWQHEVQYGETGDGFGYYDVEMFIPYRALGVNSRPKHGDKWRLNLTRNDYHDSREAVKDGKPPLPCEVVQWADTMGSNARSGCYGEINFFDPEIRAKEETARKKATTKKAK